MQHDRTKNLVISNLIARQIVKTAVLRSITQIRLHRDVTESVSQSSTQATPVPDTAEETSSSEHSGSEAIGGDDPMARNGSLPARKEVISRPCKGLHRKELPIRRRTCWNYLQSQSALSQPSGFRNTKTSSFSLHLAKISWPSGRFFNLELGKQKIEELIEKHWNYPDSLTYIVEIIGLFVMRTILRYKYRVQWQKGAMVSYVYFNFDVRRSDPDQTVKLSYTFHNGTAVHTPHTSRFHVAWLRYLDQYPNSSSEGSSNFSDTTSTSD